MLAGCTPRKDTDSYVEPPRDSPEKSVPDDADDDAIMGVTSSGLDNTLMGWGFKKEKNKAPSMPERYTSLLKNYDG